MKYMDKNTKILLIIFIVLTMVVGILGFILLQKYTQKKETENTNIVIPLLEEGIIGDKILVNTSNLKKNEILSYRFKIRNYREQILNKHELKYTLTFTVPSDVDATFYENEKKLTLEKNELTRVLKAKEKDEYTYTIVIKAKTDNPKDKVEFELK